MITTPKYYCVVFPKNHKVEMKQAKDTLRKGHLDEIESDKCNRVTEVLTKRPDLGSIPLKSMKDPATLSAMWQYHPHISVLTLCKYLDEKPSSDSNYKLLVEFTRKASMN